MKFVIIISCLAIFASCSNSQVESTQTMDQEETEKSESIDSLDYYLNIVLDSLIEIPNNKQLAIACKTHFERSRIKFNPNILNTNFIRDNFKLIQYNSIQILSVNYADWSWEEPTLLLYFIDETGKLISQDSINGCHYHNGQLSVEDWNNDKSDELIFRMHYPTTSVYHDNYIMSVYKLDSNNKLKQIFDLIERTRDCGIPVDENYGTETVRKYIWINSGKIRLTETVYKFDCETSKRDQPVVYERTISSRIYNMVWDNSIGKFVEK